MIDHAYRLSLISAVLVCTFYSCSSPVSAENIQKLSTSELLEYSDVIVLASPAETVDRRDARTEWFVVHEVFRGDPDLKSRWIRVDLGNYRFGRLRKTIHRALLFLRRSGSAGNISYEPLFSGVHYLLRTDGKVMVPRRTYIPGPFGFRIDDGADWETMLRGLREVLPLRNAMHATLDRFHRNSPWVELLPSDRRRHFAFQISPQDSFTGILCNGWPSLR